MDCCKRRVPAFAIGGAVRRSGAAKNLEYVPLGGRDSSAVCKQFRISGTIFASIIFGNRLIMSTGGCESCAKSMSLANRAVGYRSRLGIFNAPPFENC